MKGRLEHAPLEDATKYPIILPERHPVIKLLLRNTHKILGHMGRDSIVAKLRMKYWSVGLTSEIKKLLHDCIVC